MSTLFKHQVEGISFLKENPKAILADDMGLGKTRQFVLAVGDTSEGEAVVVCPASLKINWQREINEVFPEDVVYICEGRVDPAKIPADVTWIIINYDILEKNLPWLKERFESGKAETLGGDEAHYIKGKTKRSAAFIELAAVAKRVYELTGTPMLNRPIELYNLLLSIEHPLTRGETPSKARKFYATRYCGAYLRQMGRYRFWDESGATHLEELRAHLEGYMLRRKKEDVLDLPGKIITQLEVELTPEQRREYDAAWDNYLRWVMENEPDKDIGGILVAQQLVELGKLKQVCSRAKIARIVSDIANIIEQDQKVIVFSQYTETIAQIAAACRKIKHNERAVFATTLTGADKQEDRQRAVDQFQNDERTKVFVANIKAGGVGLNLTAASVVIFADMDWSPEIHAQAEDRANRIGQTGTVNVYYYVTTGTIEKQIMDLLDGKRKVIKEILEGSADRVRSGSEVSEFLKAIHTKH